MESSSDDDPAADAWIQLLIVAVLTALNAFFASAELAVLSANKTKIKLLAEQGNKKASAVEKLNADQTRFLSTIQVFITLAGFFSSATAATAFSDDLGALIVKIGVSESIATQLSVIVVTLLLSYITLVFGELYPKRVALKQPEKTAMMVAKPILVLRVVAYPFVKLLSGTTNLLVKITGKGGENEERISEEEIRSVIETGVTDGTLNEDEQKMIESIFKFDDLTAMDIMTPRVNVCMVDVEDDVRTVADMMIFEQYSRVPVYKDDRDSIVGVLMLKDFMASLYRQGYEKTKIEDNMRQPFFVTDKIKIDALFALLKKTHNYMAILTDEFGGFTGIVTIEDLLEEIVGNIYDEYDDYMEPIVEESENVYIIDGLTPIQDINREIGTEFDEDCEDYDTLGGLMVSLLGRLPNKNEKAIFTVDNADLEILQIDRHRVSKVRLTVKPKLNESENDE